MSEIIHHVKRIGETEFTSCGLKFTNTSNVGTENKDIVTCKKCFTIVLEDEKDGN